LSIMDVPISSIIPAISGFYGSSIYFYSSSI